LGKIPRDWGAKLYEERESEDELAVARKTGLPDAWRTFCHSQRLPVRCDSGRIRRRKVFSGKSSLEETLAAKKGLFTATEVQNERKA